MRPWLARAEAKLARRNVPQAVTKGDGDGDQFPYDNSTRTRLELAGRKLLAIQAISEPFSAWCAGTIQQVLNALGANRRE